jgi:molecular chaperone GrpE
VADEERARGAGTRSEEEHVDDGELGTTATDDLPSEDGVDLELRAAADPRDRAQLLGDLEVAERARDEYLDDLRRALADFENYRKRVARDASAQREHGRADVVAALLDALDDLDRVVAAATGDVDAGTIASAVGVAADKAQRALSTLGVTRVDVAGVAFDPTVHDAVQQVPDEAAEEPTVREVLRPGYRLGERVLRAAMVVVAQR